MLRQTLADANKRIAELEKQLEDIISDRQATADPEKNCPEDLLESTALLRKSKNRYRKYFNYATDAMFVFTLDSQTGTIGKFADVNKEATRRLGYSREEFFKMSPRDINLPNSDHRIQQYVASLLREGRNSFEATHVTRDGRHIPVEIHTLLLNVDGEQLILAAARDISERKQAELKLKESERLYRLLADNVHDVIWTADTNLKPVFISPSITNLSGHNPAEALPVLYRSIILTSPLFKNFQRTVYKTEITPIHWETELTRKDGSSIWVESIASPLWDNAGTFSGIVGVTRDITSRKAIMIELEAAKEQANNANNAKSEFLANMSHEIRTPMNGVLGTLQLLGLTQLSREQREYVETALKSGKSLLTIINDILDFSKIEAGKIEIRNETFSPRECIASLIASFKTIAPAPELNISSHIDREVPEMIVADHIRFRQILSNLIGNAVKFTGQGEVSIFLRSDKQPAEDKIRLECTVTDTGIGLPEHVGQELFDPFAQIESTFRRRFKGTGLGLSIVKQLVALMGGTIVISGKENEGTKVVFDIMAGIAPVLAGVQESQPPDSQPDRPHHRKNILLVEDDLINQQILRSVLEKLGHYVTIVHNGRQALQAIVEDEYDFVLMDIQMPVMDGFEATRRIRTYKEFEEVADIPIIALTAFAMTGDKERCLQAGMNDYLSKPVDITALEEILQQYEPV